MLRLSGRLLGAQLLRAGDDVVEFRRQCRQFLAALQHPGGRIPAPRHLGPVGADPDAVRGHRGFPRGKGRAQGEGGVEAVGGMDAGEQGMGLGAPHPVGETLTGATRRDLRAPRLHQGQFALGNAVEGRHQGGKRVDTHRLEASAEHGFHRQFPTRIHFEGLGQAPGAAEILAVEPRPLLAVVLEGGLLEGLERGLTPP